jgi:hypothetical protein
MLPTLYKYLKRKYAERMMAEGEVYIGDVPPSSVADRFRVRR